MTDDFFGALSVDGLTPKHPLCSWRADDRAPAERRHGLVLRRDDRPLAPPFTAYWRRHRRGG
jgi:hypothetical protein